MRLAFTAALVAALALVFAACGDDEGDTTVVNTTTVIEGSDDATTATTTPDEIDADDGDPDDGDDLVEPDDDEPALALKAFRSPTGNIACMLSAKSVRCDIAAKNWTAPRPPGCPGEVDFGQGLTMNASGPAQVVCAGDTVLNPRAVVLEYGQTSRIGSIECESDDEGMDCSNDAGGEFSLSRDSYELN
jgi:hypothetical protein